ncbi:dual specificity protein kinase splA-like [Frieseomelitta varia]|uniref:dual specificity protein kinase splA-like n=1 Tax=Frieseomelitta varia TaxID=561572 RepID=UPI001CB6AF30|nr:dual specificity protein kinase splA-like [Frieseomelitta varia]
MGGPGAGRVSRHELNAVPKSDVGHGDRTLVIGEPTAPAPACRCHPPTSIATSTSNSTTSGHHLVPAQLPPSPPPLASLHIAVDNNCIGNSSIGNNNNTTNTTNTTTAKPDAISNGTKAAATMSSPPKHRRGFDPNDVNATDYRRYRRVKTTRRGFVCSTP